MSIEYKLPSLLIHLNRVPNRYVYSSTDTCDDQFTIAIVAYQRIPIPSTTAARCHMPSDRGQLQNVRPLSPTSASAPKVRASQLRLIPESNSFRPAPMTPLKATSRVNPWNSPEHKVFTELLPVVLPRPPIPPITRLSALASDRALLHSHVHEL